MDLERRLGDINPDINGGGVCFHMDSRDNGGGGCFYIYSGDVCWHGVDRVLTHPYVYELRAEAGALATVRVLSTGRVRLRLGYGLVKNRPRVGRARTRHRGPLRGGRGLNFLPGQEKQKEGKNARTN